MKAYPEVTIAIPVYNAQKYIVETLNSALSQTFESIEFLIIDDKGNDNSIEIIEQIQKTHLRGEQIKIIHHNENKGIASARNTAIKNASGRYLFFLDSDDLISEDCIDVLHTAIVAQNGDIAIGSHKHYNENSKETNYYILPQLSSCKEDEFANLRYGELHHCLGFYVWNILFRLNFIHENELSFKAFKIGEDIVFLYDFIPLVKSFALSSNITYTYVKRENSLSMHGKRDCILLSEIQEQVKIRIYGKKSIIENKNKFYIENMVSNQMKYFFEAASYIVELKRRIVPPMDNTLISDLIKYPLSRNDIATFKKKKYINYIYYYWSKCPAKYIIWSLTIFHQMLKISWSIKKRIKTKKV